MFKAPFSFNGRIRRTEFAVTFFIYAVVLTGLVLILIPDYLEPGSPYRKSSHTEFQSALFFIIFIPLIIFVCAQGAKRAHDLGKSGWYMFIPFYVLWLLFADSQPGRNEYGYNPKGIGNEDFSFEKEQDR
jgi:uncharacterized membrane protein YhaH (DUF805 family)